MSFKNIAIIVGKHHLDNKQEIPITHVMENLPELLVHVLRLGAIKDYE